MKNRPKPAPLPNGTVPQVLPGQMTVEEVVEHVSCDCPVCRVMGGKKSKDRLDEESRKKNRPMTAAEAVAARLKEKKG
jgi:hypothetical protein